MHHEVLRPPCGSNALPPLTTNGDAFPPEISIQSPSPFGCIAAGDRQYGAGALTLEIAIRVGRHVMTERRPSLRSRICAVSGWLGAASAVAALWFTAATACAQTCPPPAIVRAIVA